MEKGLFSFIVAICTFATIISCQKFVPAELNVQQSELSFTKEGGNQSISFSTNKDWTASASASWVKVTSSGTSSATSISVTVDPNPEYDDRTATITIKAEDLTKTVSIKQSTNLGLLVTKNKYELTNDAQTIEIEVQANVEFEYSIDDACKGWITTSATKALSSSKVKFDIAKNDSYDNREGKIVFKQKGGALTETVTISQSQINGLFISKTEYSISNEEQTIPIEIKTNVDFEAKSNVNWIQFTQTKSLETTSITIKVSQNTSYDSRTGKVTFSQINGELSETVSIEQKGIVNYVEINTIEGDKLKNQLGAETRYTITHLKVIGPIDGEEVFMIRNMAGCRYQYPNPERWRNNDLWYLGPAVLSVSGKLQVLDLSEATFIPGGKYAYPKSEVGSDGSSSYGYCHYSQVLKLSESDIGNFMFTDCTQLKEIVLPNFVTDIGLYAFEDCPPLDRLVLSENLKGDNSYFPLCNEIVVPSNNQRYVIREGILYSRPNPDCEPNRIVRCTKNHKLGSEFILPPGVGLSPKAFAGCVNIEKIDVTNGSELELCGVFDDCNISNLYCRSNNLSGLSSIGKGAEIVNLYFSSKSTNTKVYIRGLLDCKISNIWFETSTPPSIDATYFKDRYYVNREGLSMDDDRIKSLQKNATLHVPKGSLGNYKYVTFWGDFHKIEEYDL